jgi:O-antigen ligase
MAVLTQPSETLWRRRVPLAWHARASAPEKPDLLLYAIAIMVWTYVWRVQDLFPVLGTLRISLIAAALAVGLFALDRHPARSATVLKTPVVLCALGLFAIAILGVPGSLWPGRSATFLLKDFVPNVVLLVLVAASVRSVRDLEWINWVNVLGACVFSAFVLLSFDIGPSGRLGRLVYYDANDLALVVVCTIPFSVFLLVRSGWTHRLLSLAIAMLFIVTLSRSGSRGGFLGFLAVLAYALVGFRAIPVRARVLTALGGLGLLTLTASDAYLDRVRSLRNLQQDYNWSGGATEGRMEVWKRGVRYMAEHPFLGVGMRNFSMAEGMLSEESKARMARGAGFKWSVAHNSFLEIGVELGVIGLALFVGMLTAAIRVLGRIKSARRSKDRGTVRELAFACTLTASLIGYVVAGFFVSAWYFSYLYMVLGLVVGFAKIDRFARVPLYSPQLKYSRTDAHAPLMTHSGGRTPLRRWVQTRRPNGASPRDPSRRDKSR